MAYFLLLLPLSSYSLILPCCSCYPLLLVTTPFLQVVDGTTLYFDGSAPKIVVAPSSDNTTPEAIQPTVTVPTGAIQRTVTDQRAGATEIQAEDVEIEGSVGHHQV